MKKQLIVLTALSLLSIGLASADTQSYGIQSINSNGVISYIVKKGDTVTDLADYFGVSADTIRSANDLDNDKLMIGDTLSIVPDKGTSIVISTDTSIASLSSQFGIAQDKIMQTNDFDDDQTIVTAGSEVFLPLTQQQIQDKLALAPKLTTGKLGGTAVDISAISQAKSQTYLGQAFDEAFGTQEILLGKGSIIAQWFQKGDSIYHFVAGNCTAYAASKRPDIFANGKGFRGDAKDRANNAKKAGYAVGNIPKRNAIAVFAPGRGGDKTYGHVAYVEAVDIKNNKIQITDMNYLGRNIVTRRIISADLAAAYIY